MSINKSKLFKTRATRQSASSYNSYKNKFIVECFFFIDYTTVFRTRQILMKNFFPVDAF